ncbi:MAG: hypothetical protein ACXAC7_02215, partial [Candidatus Hodarchaeales archaeon]
MVENTTNMSDLFQTALNEFENRNYIVSGKFLEKIRGLEDFNACEINFQVKVNYLLARVKRNQTKFDEAYQLIQETLSKPISLQHKADAQHILSSIAFNTGELNYALSFVKKELEIAGQIPNETQVGKCYYYLGEINRFLGRYSESLEAHMEGYNIREGSITSSAKKELSRTLNGISLAHRALSNVDQAQYFSEKVLELDLNIHNHEDAVIAYYNLFLLSLSNPDSKQAYLYRDKLDNDQILNEELLTEPILQLMNGFLEIKGKNYEIAQKLFDKAINFLEELPFFEITVSARLGIIEALLLGWKYKITNFNKFDK